MAAVNLPDSPADGDTQDVGGITYTYNASKGYWTAASSGGGGGGGASVTTNDSAPGSPSDGDLWYDTDDGGMFVYYEDADSSQWVEVIGSQGAAGPAGASGGAGVASVYATVDALPTSGNTQGDMAHVTANNTLYFWNGSGWYKIALINTNPSISGVASAYALAIDGTATTVTVTATDPEGLPITYSIASDTSGNIATVSQGTGASTNVFTITPSTNTAYAGSFTLTFRASDGVNIATAPATFTLQFQVQNKKYTTALITSIGANNGTNSSFDDKSTSDHTITANGAAHQSTFSPYRSGGYSTYFDGSGDYLEIDDGTWLTLGNGDFCFETWIYNTASTGASQYICGQANSAGHANSVSAELYINSSRNLQGGIYVGSQKYATSTGTIPLNTWTHVALVRNGGNIQLYINGTKDGENTSAGTDSANDQSTHFSIGRGGEVNSLYFNGYITDFRFVKGSSVHTGNFTAPTERLTAITYTELLTCHLPYIADGSTNGHTIAVNGDTGTKPFAPYDSQEYSAASHGASISLDGGGDYLTVADHADLDMGSSDFTIEGWYYPKDNPGGSADGLIAKRANSSGVGGILLYFAAADSTPSLLVDTGGSWGINQQATGKFNVGSWNHFAIVRNGTAFKLYINGKSVLSATSSATIPDNGSAFTIGAISADGSYPISMGNVSDVRVVKGTAVYTAEFTPPTAPLTAITNTKLLVQSTDASIIDKVQGSRQTELIGTVSSTTYTKYYNSSIYFDGSNDYIELKDMPELPGPFTIEMWIWVPSGTVSQSKTFFTIGTVSSSGNCLLIYRYSNTNNIGVWNGGSTILASSSAIPQTQWAHLALTRNSSNTINVWINGVDKGSVSNSNNFIPGTHGIKIGSENPLGYYFNGYMSDIRITKGLARYTSTFTPPTAALQG